MSRLSQSPRLPLTLPLVLIAICLLSFSASAQPGEPRPSPTPQKRKLPVGTRGFAQFAGRDASDKLIVGGATRGADAASLYQQGEELQKAGKVTEARKAFEAARDAFARAARSNPTDPSAHYHLGVAYETLRQYPEAVKAYREALSRDIKYPVNLFATYNLANTHAAAGQHAEALEAYQQLLRLDANLAMPHYNMGLSYAALNRPAEAVTAFKEAIRLQPEGDNETDRMQLAQTYYNLGVTHGTLEQFDEAAAAFREAVRLNPANTDARYNLALAYITLGDRAAATAQINVLRRTKPDLAGELGKLLPR